jgi:hypothetical protein
VVSLGKKGLSWLPTSANEFLLEFRAAFGNQCQVAYAIVG